jgi:hypothetical protein
MKVIAAIALLSVSAWWAQRDNNTREETETDADTK